MAKQRNDPSDDFDDSELDEEVDDGDWGFDNDKEDDW
jgi:hypothetical protein